MRSDKYNGRERDKDELGKADVERTIRTQKREKISTRKAQKNVITEANCRERYTRNKENWKVR